MPRKDSALAFRVMAFELGIRDKLKPRLPYLEEAGVRQGMTVLDFGCGPGGYTIPAAQLVGDAGKVYALDRQPAALAMARGSAAKAGLANVETILSDRDTGLPDGSVDIVLLNDIYHSLAYPAAILAELHRVLKPAGILSSHDHHLRKTVLKRSIESTGLFRMTRAGALTLTFVPERKDA